ncbi:Fic domain protein, Pden_3305 type [hydrothermal vent metagenome]|uniref:Fic domain protein, Pden_3305 type n=2 Tax=hydrothermal vent metagenome TaxID=652676 RepID=A0A3B0SUH7_9ZZZZ
MAGSQVSFDWRERQATAWVPAVLKDRSLELSPSTIRSTEKAAAALHRSDERLPPNWEPLARLILRTEGIASSSVEGLRAPIEQVALAELRPVPGDVGWIADNLWAFEAALATPELRIDTLHSWHTKLMGNSALPDDLIGSFRTSPGWIGGTSPLDAVYVPPPAELIDELMADLIEFATSDAVDPVTQAAVVHAQFETIHPYGDGNGRLGRILIGWILRSRGVVDRLPPPISVLVARDPGGYLAGLYAFRERSLDEWVAWFADTSIRAAHQSDVMIDEVGRVLGDWKTRISGLRADSTAHVVLELLPQIPVLDARTLARHVGVSERSARNALEALEQHEIVVPVDVEVGQRGRPARWWAARELLNIAQQWVR